MTSKIDNMTPKIDMIHRLFGSKTRVALLSKLMMNADRSFYIRELSKNLRIPYSVLYKEEKNLVSLGILNEEKKGKVTLVSANKRLPYFSQLKGLIMRTSGLGNLVRSSLSGLKRTRYALIYGSFASGEESDSSDIDVLIIGDVREEKVLKAITRIEEETGREVNYLLWNDQEFRKKIESKHHLLTDIADNPIIMLIGEESELRRAVEK